jgi:hypothetical protein
MFRLEPFYNFRFCLFCQQKVLVDEILNCLLLGFNQASIFTTNHLLERVLKVSLMRKYTEGLFIGNPEFNKKSNEAKNQYDNQTLRNNIQCAFDLKILTQEERDKLIELKNKFRNPYSHAQMSPILKDLPQEFTGFMGSSSDAIDALNKGISIPMEKISVPTHIMEQEIQKDEANYSALDYFQEVFKIMCSIENKMNKSEIEQLNNKKTPDNEAVYHKRRCGSSDRLWDFGSEPL